MLRRKDSASRNRRARKCLAPLEELVLPSTKLKFQPEQLHNLNFHFARQLDEPASRKPTSMYKLPASARTMPAAHEKLPLAAATAERLLQRLVCGVGIIEPNFASKYLIRLNNENADATTMQYLLRLDHLSTPTLYSTDAQPDYSIVENSDFLKGYARIRVNAAMMPDWGLFTNNQGYLRRDKIQAKYVELLAATATSDIYLDPTNLDESTLCGSPGKVVDVCTLRNILKRAPDEHIYFGGNGKDEEFPDPRDFRLAIVDEPCGIRLRLEFLKADLTSVTMTMRLLIGIEMEGWPASTDFPARIPLGHPDALLYNQAGQMGAYLVGYGVQSSAWQVRFPAAEDLLMKHYSSSSAVRGILALSKRLLEDVYRESGRHQKYQYSYRMLNEYLLKTMLMYELEKDFTNPTRLIMNWSPRMLSVHMLKILDQLVHALCIQRYPNYFHPTVNLLANPGHLCEDDYLYESRMITELLLQLYHTSLAHTKSTEYEKFIVSQELEILLLHRWKELIDSLLPPSSMRARRFCFNGSQMSVAYTQYTSRQLEYLALLFRAALRVHNNRIVLVNDERDDSCQVDNCQMDGAHDLIYIIVVLLRQAKEHFLKSNPSGKVRRKLATGFDPCVGRLVDVIRAANESIIDDVDFVKVVLKWLYRALDQNRRLLAPLLRPYLNILFVTSHGNAWFLDHIRQRMHSSEVESLALYNTLINSEGITPAEGLVDCVSKKWIWAKDFLSAIREQPVTVIFAPMRGKCMRHVMSVPEMYEAKLNANAIISNHHLNSNPSDEAASPQTRFGTLSRTSYFSSFISTHCCKSTEKHTSHIPWHCILRDSSPMNAIFRHVHRQGEHRCDGDIMLTLLSMQKMNIVNEIATILPPDDRNQLVDVLQKFNFQRSKSMMRLSRPLISNAAVSCYSYEKYTPMDENATLALSRNSSLSDSNATIEVRSLKSMKSVTSTCTSISGSSGSQPCDRTLRLRHSESMKM